LADLPSEADAAAAGVGAAVGAGAWHPARTKTATAQMKTGHCRNDVGLNEPERKLMF